MNANIYNSFEEINKDLKILRLKREINKENMKFGLQRAKSNLHPFNLLVDFKEVLQQNMLVFAIKNLRRLTRLG